MECCRTLALLDIGKRIVIGYKKLAFVVEALNVDLMNKLYTEVCRLAVCLATGVVVLRRPERRMFCARIY